MREGNVAAVGTISSDPSGYRSSNCAMSGIYDGDARAMPEGWSRPDFDDDAWEAVAIGERDLETLAAPDGPPITRVMSVAPVSIERRAADRLMVDFGQNLVGRIEFSASGSRGDVVRIRHAEVLQKGELFTRPLRTARATDSYIFAGKGTTPVGTTAEVSLPDGSMIELAPGIAEHSVRMPISEDGAPCSCQQTSPTVPAD